jgi:radical SAM family uncharacterized protein/radical SAM-linked protein
MEKEFTLNSNLFIKDVALEDILLAVEKPSRYTGGEVNASRKNRRDCKLSFALAFPDTYEVGMSHLGLQILYAILDGYRDVAVERCYAPWPDMEHWMRKYSMPLVSLESRIPLRHFDVVGFSLQYELSYTNVLNMLDMGGIPVHREERTDEHPLVIAGGPCAFNPAPMEAFMDAFVVGEGEEVISEIVQTLLSTNKKGRGRLHLLEKLSDLKGLFVPSIHTRQQSIRKRIIPDLNNWCLPVKPVVPLMKIIHDRATLEIARGCTRGCRFCQAGMVWRPVRERRPDVIEQMAENMLCFTGYDELSLLSLSSGDYTQIEPLLENLMDRYRGRHVALALPSLRAETLTQRLIENIKRVRKTNFTLAPEAGTQRMRDIINKGSTESDLLATTARVFEAGWKSIKLYFMIGLPDEKDDDLYGIINLAQKVLNQTRNRGQVTVSLSTFVPKPHTPFQWHRQIDVNEIIKKQALIKKYTYRQNLTVKWHDARMSLLEGLFSRGDEKIGLLVERAFYLGCRFDGWTDKLSFEAWKSAIKESGIDTGTYLGERTMSETLPWDHIDAGIQKDFLIREYEKSQYGGLTADCRWGHCTNCGICDYKTIQLMMANEGEKESPIDPQTVDFHAPHPKRPFRIKFSKQGMARFLSHLEVSSALIRAINQGGFHLAYSNGFHPHPKISFAFATAVGMESLGEYTDIWFEDMEEGNIPQVIGKTNGALPDGLKIVSIHPVAVDERPLSECITGFEYRILIPQALDDTQLSLMVQHMNNFMKTEDFIVSRERKGKTFMKNIRPFIQHLTMDRDNRQIKMAVSFGNMGTTSPTEVMTKIIGISKEVILSMRIIKTNTFFKQ